MAAMMPSASTSNAVYDNDAVERDLIDPDDGASQLPMLWAMHPHAALQHQANGTQQPSMTSTTRCRGPRTARRSRGGLRRAVQARSRT
jgi:hypothetical protein